MSLDIMDIPVSRLNQRMALQLPAEFPLGLVFVVGQVQMPDGAEDSFPSDFYLADSEYRLPCRLSERAAGEVQLDDGDMVRAGGHLAFEPAQARYYLLARDVEYLDGLRPAVNPLVAIIADNSRREQAASLAPAELPSWVQQMAPPEIRQQGDRNLTTGLAEPIIDSGDDWESLADARSAVAYPAAEPELAAMSDELIDFLSQAMDSEQEVEITSDIIADLNETGTTDRLPSELMAALDELEANVGSAPRSPLDLGDPEESPAAEAKLNQAPDDSFGFMVGGEAQLPLDLLDELEAELADADSGPEPEAPADDAVAAVIEAAEGADLAEPAAETEPEVVPEPDNPQPAAKAAPLRRKQRTRKDAKKTRTIPWYVVLLIVVVFLIVLAAFVFLLLNPDSLSINLPLEFPQDLALPG
ncbi:MAG: hypothetical protein JSW55_00610 [Chloroflexota bacterium]|nr:MAG: hypothetical protein JSW55_00610 [Chloroflexota bacterium]